ncbi:MAG: hypothetical protein ABIP75_01230, partial [Pyrinomonadaceae bacterium]
MRKELGGDEDDQPTVDQQMARLEVDIRRLKVEFDIFFNGGVKHPPYETRNRVETTFARLGDDRTLTYAQRYKYNSLASRFASFRDMWRRSMQSKEEGRDFITVARAKLTAMREAADAEIAARNAAKYGTNETTANEAPPAATLIEKPAPELAAPALVDAPARAFKKGPVITATVVPVASSALPPPQLELVAPVKTESKSESARVPATVEPETLAANESLDTNGEGRPIAGAEPDGNKSDATMASVFVDLSNEYQTDGFVIDPVPVDIENITHEFEPGATNIDPAHADQLVAAFEPDVEVISPSAHEQLPVDDGDKRLKQMPTRFPKILPPS